MAIVLVSLVSFTCAQTNSTDRSRLFDTVWDTINDNFYDEHFEGHDWESIGHKYRQKLIAAKDDSTFFVGLNEMLFTLGVSHCGVIPSDHPEWIGAPSVFSTGWTGANLQVLEDQMVLTDVAKSSPAARAGLRRGDVVVAVNGMNLADLRRKSLRQPRAPLDERLLLNQSVREQFYGPAGSSATVEWVSEGNASRKATIVLEERPGMAEFIEGIPPVFLDFEAKWLTPEIGYIRFNVFHPDLLDKIVGALGDMREAKGIILDIRNNAGGVSVVRRTLIERLLTKESQVWRYVGRRGVETVTLRPSEDSYRGEVVILVNCMSASSSEEFAGALQATGRARIVGERTPGDVLVADVIPLEDGSTLIVPVAQTQLPDGTILEGRGVMPDLEILTTAASLRAGEDRQLEAARLLIREGI